MGTIKKPRDGWVQTVSGRMVFPVRPDPREIVIEDIAHALALQCRFNGHTKEFYSIAQHSVIVSLNCQRFPLLGLMHDAAEAYIGDVVTPIKQEIKAFGLLEIQVWKSIAAELGLPIRANTAARDEIKRMDAAALATELRDLMATPPRPWMLTQKPFEQVIVPVDWREARRMFLERYDALTRPPLAEPRRTNTESQADQRTDEPCQQEETV